MQKLKTKYGSVLVFSLIVLFIGVVAALGIASTTIISQKMSGTTGKSVSSFQVADSGAEIFLKAVKDAEGGDTLLRDLGLTCSGGTISGNIGTGKDYDIIAYKLDGSTITNCNTAISDIDKIKSTGTYASTSRAVEMAIAAGCKAGFAQIGSFCIEKNEDTDKTTWYDAVKKCEVKNARLCMGEELYLGCESSSVDGFVSDSEHEWSGDAFISSTTANDTSLIYRWNTECDDRNSWSYGYKGAAAGDTYQYRCCYTIAR